MASAERARAHHESSHETIEAAAAPNPESLKPVAAPKPGSLDQSQRELLRKMLENTANDHHEEPSKPKPAKGALAGAAAVGAGFGGFFTMAFALIWTELSDAGAKLGKALGIKLSSGGGGGGKSHGGDHGGGGHGH